MVLVQKRKQTQLTQVLSNNMRGIKNYVTKAMVGGKHLQMTFWVKFLWRHLWMAPKKNVPKLQLGVIGKDLILLFSRAMI